MGKIISSVSTPKIHNKALLNDPDKCPTHTEIQSAILKQNYIPLYIIPQNSINHNKLIDYDEVSDTEFNWNITVTGMPYNMALRVFWHVHNTTGNYPSSDYTDGKHQIYGSSGVANGKVYQGSLLVKDVNSGWIDYTCIFGNGNTVNGTVNPSNYRFTGSTNRTFNITCTYTG